MFFDPLNQSSGQQHWLKSYGVKTRSIVVVTIGWIVFFMSVSLLKIGRHLDVKIADPISFSVRDGLGMSPRQSERLKIYAIDDATFAMIGRSMPDLELWGDVLSSIAERRPKAILIDAMFSENNAPLTPRAKLLFKGVAATGVPVITGGYPDVVVSHKLAFALTSDRYRLERYISGSEQMNADRLSGTIPRWPDLTPQTFYGPGEVGSSLFKQVGHFWLKEEHRVAPFLRFNDNVVPHMSLFVAGSIKFQGQRIVVDSNAVALDGNGDIPVNFLRRDAMKIKGMIRLINDAKEGYVADQVNSGDVVLILPMYYTGNTDMRPSPYGLIPGGLYLAAMINSVLTGQWLQPVLASEALIILMAVVAAGTAYMASVRWLVPLWFSTAIGFFVTVQILFSWYGLVVPYILPILSGSVVVGHVLILKLRGYERKTMALRMALEGSVSPKQIEILSRNPDQVNLEPRERILTLMFIDVVGFSLSSENMLPRMAFENLKSILSEMSNIIYAHGGVIDKTLGDGLLCYFGYRVETDETVSDHPEQAVRCAAEIQRKVLSECLDAMKTGAPLYPVRIGLNTASCYLGDIGSGRRIEFTVVGNGVNFAKRLEAACDIFKIMIGSTTYDMIKGLELARAQVVKKLIKIKHHHELIDAYEVSPLADRKEECEQVISAFRWASSLHRVVERMPVKDSSSLKVMTPYGEPEVVNFSGSGISLLFSQPLMLGEVISIMMDSRKSGLARDLQGLGLVEIKAEIRWHYQDARGFVHGLMFVGLSEEHQKEFKRLVAHYAFSNVGFGSEGVNDDVAS